jgi:hypothetical protein
MRAYSNVWRSLPFLGLAVFLILAGCDGAGAGGGSGSGTNGGNCDTSTSHTITWEISGSYGDAVVSVATTWVADGTTNATQPSASHIDPVSGTLLTETLSGCSSASMNITMLDGGADDVVVLTDLVLSISVDGSVAESVTLNGTYTAGQTLPDSTGIVVTF